MKALFEVKLSESNKCNQLYELNAAGTLCNVTDNHSTLVGHNMTIESCRELFTYYMRAMIVCEIKEGEL